MFASIVVFAKHVHFISVSMFYATDKKSEVAFQCLIHLLPSPPRKRVKVPQLFPELLLKQFFLQDMEAGIYVFTFSGSMAAFAAGMHCSI